MNSKPVTQEPASPAHKSSLLSLVGSILAGAFGVQSSKNRERDFSQGKTLHFAIAGTVFTVIFIATIVTIVNIVLKKAGM